MVYDMHGNKFENGCGCGGEGCGCNEEGCGRNKSNWNGARNFLTKKEKLELLKEYKEQLENEVKGVSEKIKELQKDTDL